MVGDWHSIWVRWLGLRWKESRTVERRTETIVNVETIIMGMDAGLGLRFVELAQQDISSDIKRIGVQVSSATKWSARSHSIIIT